MREKAWWDFSTDQEVTTWSSVVQKHVGYFQCKYVKLRLFGLSGSTPNYCLLFNVLNIICSVLKNAVLMTLPKILFF